jgi:hypothetical protein
MLSIPGGWATHTHDYEVDTCGVGHQVYLPIYILVVSRSEGSISRCRACTGLYGSRLFIIIIIKALMLIDAERT